MGIMSLTMIHKDPVFKEPVFHGFRKGPQLCFCAGPLHNDAPSLTSSMTQDLSDLCELPEAPEGRIKSQRNVATQLPFFLCQIFLARGDFVE